MEARERMVGIMSMTVVKAWVVLPGESAEGEVEGVWFEDEMSEG